MRASPLRTLLPACGSPAATSQPARASHDAAFTALARDVLDDLYRRQPTQATYLGIHKYDDRLEDYSHQAVTDAVAALRQFRERASAIDPGSLSPENQLDREQLLHAIDSRLFTLEVVRPWVRDADTYSSGLTNTAYIMIKREFAPPEQRLRQLIAREKAMPAALAEARRNLARIRRGSTRRSPSISSTATAHSSRMPSRGRLPA